MNPAANLQFNIKIMTAKTADSDTFLQKCLVSVIQTFADGF